MIHFKTGTPSKKQKKQIESLLTDIVDLYGDFFITRDNIRLFLRDNPNLLFEGLSKGDKIIFGEEGIVFVDGFSDKANRNYVKILTKDVKATNDLLKVLNWNLSNIPLYIKIKKDNINVTALKKCGFRLLGSRGKEDLYIRNPKNINFQIPKEKDEENDQI
jgi:hypothetical protein